MVITQKHPNVMQYKETPSPLPGNWTLDRAYAELTGDTPLYSVFRVNGEPVPCPFRDTYHFSYNRGSGNCSSPPSISDFCTDKNRVLFNFKACYDTLSESRKETLTCVGTWKEGSHHYLVGKVRCLQHSFLFLYVFVFALYSVNASPTICSLYGVASLESPSFLASENRTLI